MALLFSVLLFIGSLFFFVYESEHAEIQDTYESGALKGEVHEARKLQKRLAKTLDGTSVQLCFKGELLACDRESLTFYLPVDMETDAWEAGTFADQSGEFGILPLEDYTRLEKKETVSSGYAVPFLAWNEKEGTCTTIYVVFTGLPVVRMETDASLDVDTVFAGSVEFYENCGKEDWTLKSVFQAHERGQTTRAYPKKGYRVDLISVTSTGVINKNKEKVLGMRKSDSWIFYAIYSDGTKVRDQFNTRIWDRLGAWDTPYDTRFGTSMKYVELVVNGEYRGLYGIFEPIDSTQLEISDQEYLYKRTYGRELLAETMDSVAPSEYLTVLGMELKGRNGQGNGEDWKCFRTFVEMCQSDDETFRAEAEKLLNMDNVADIWLYLQMMYAEDNIYKNMFFAFKKESDGYRMYLVPWDTDLTWGNTYVDDGEQLYVQWSPEHVQDYLEWPFLDRLLKLDVGNIREKVAARWQKLRQDELSDENLKNMLDDCIHEVQDSGAFARDAVRWPDSRHDGDYEGMQSYMKERLAYLDKNFKNMDEWIQD